MSEIPSNSAIDPRRYAAAYHRFWPLIRASLAILNLFTAFAVAVAAKDALWSAITFSSQARYWALILLFVGVWIVAQKLSATVLEGLLRAMGLIGTLVIDSEGVSLSTRSQTQVMAWRDVRSVTTGPRRVKLTPNFASQDLAAAVAAVPIVEGASKLASGLWVLALNGETKSLVIEGTAVVWPVAVEKRLLEALQAQLGMKLAGLDKDARADVSR
jgi:hypothetical protein